MSLSQYYDGNNADDDLSPVSALRMNFDQLPTETTDPITPSKNVFGVPVPQFVPESIISWLDNNVDAGSLNVNQLDSQLSPSDTVVFSNNELNINPIVKKVCDFVATENGWAKSSVNIF